MNTKITILLLATGLLVAQAYADNTSVITRVFSASASESADADGQPAAANATDLAVARLGYSYNTPERQTATGVTQHQIPTDGGSFSPEPIESRAILGITAIPIIKGDLKDSFAYVPSVSFTFDLGPVRHS
jgi:hypothetical protein